MTPYVRFRAASAGRQFGTPQRTGRGNSPQPFTVFASSKRSAQAGDIPSTGEQPAGASA